MADVADLRERVKVQRGPEHTWQLRWTGMTASSSELRLNQPFNMNNQMPA